MPPIWWHRSNRLQGPISRRANGDGRLNGGQHHGGRPYAARPDRRPQARVVQPTLKPEASAVLRDHLVREINGLGSSDDAALWAHRHMSEKNKLTKADAQLVEEAFQARLAALVANATPQSQETGKAKNRRTLSSSKNGPRSKGVDKATLTLPEPRRVRDREHVRYVAQQPCLICGRSPSDPHHLRFAQSRALGRKVSDEFTVPLCRGHHRELHRCGDEAAWWQRAGIDPTITARTLWLETHPLPAIIAEQGETNTDCPTMRP